MLLIILLSCEYDMQLLTSMPRSVANCHQQSCIARWSTDIFNSLSVRRIEVRNSTKTKAYSWRLPRLS